MITLLFFFFFLPLIDHSPDPALFTTLSLSSFFTQHATGRKGLFRTLLVEQKPLSIKNDFKPKATMPENMPPPACLEDTSVRGFFFYRSNSLTQTLAAHTPPLLPTNPRKKKSPGYFLTFFLYSLCILCLLLPRRCEIPFAFAHGNAR